MENIRRSYSYYKRVTKNPVDIKTYIDLCNRYNQFLMDKALQGEEVTLPSRFGTLSVTGKKQKISIDEEGNIKGLAPNWKKTKELWESNPEEKEKKTLIFCTNEHTSGIRYKFLWSKKNVIISNKVLYSLRVTRTNKRVLNRLIMKGKEY